MPQPATTFEAPAITPFWHRLPHFFAYPLHWRRVCCMAALALATLVGFILPLETPYAHALAHAVVWLAFLSYAYKTLDETAHGLLTPAQSGSAEVATRALLPYKQFAIFALTGLALLIADRVGGVFFGAILVFSIFALPASILILSITRSFWSGVNPVGALAMMRTIGLPYLGLCAFLFLFLASQGGLQRALPASLAPTLLLPLLNFVAMYFTLVMFNLMGYVVWQYHSLLGAPSRAAARAAASAGDPGDAIGRLLADGKIDEALGLAYEAQRLAPNDVAAQRVYHRLLAQAGREERLLSHARRYLTLLLRRAQGEEALELHAAMQALDPRFTPEQPAQLLRLAEAARERGEFAQALALVKGYDKRFPKSAEIPAVYLFAARVLGEDLHQDENSRRLLDVLIKRFPDQCAEARQLLAALDGVAAPLDSG